MEIVKKYIAAMKLDPKSDHYAEIIPKFQGQEGIELVHPQLVVVLARELLRQNFELPPAFEALLHISHKLIERATQIRKLRAGKISPV